MNDKLKLEIDVNEQDVKEALLNSAIKNSVSEMIVSALKEAWNGYEVRNGIQKTIAQHINSVVKELIETKYKDSIKEKVTELLTKNTVEKICDDVGDAFLARIERGY